MIAEGIFNSVIRYGIAVYLNPIYEKEDPKAKKLTGNIREIQKIQNDMLRVILGYNLAQQINMEKTRTKIDMMSVNQMAIYHTLLGFNVFAYPVLTSTEVPWLYFHTHSSIPSNYISIHLSRLALHIHSCISILLNIQ